MPRTLSTLLTPLLVTLTLAVSDRYLLLERKPSRPLTSGASR